MNVALHQEEKNEETKKGERRAGKKKKRKQATDFEEAVCCPSAVVQGEHGEKRRGVPGVTGTLGKANSHFGPTQMGSGTAPPRLGGY